MKLTGSEEGIMRFKKLKTKAWPEGRDWPGEIVLDVGSNMPHDVYGVDDSDPGVRYVRHDIAAGVMIEALTALQEKCGEAITVAKRSLNQS